MRPSHIVSSVASTCFIPGLISLKKAEAFERVMWRALRGNVIIKTVCLPSSSSSDEKKSAFIVFCHGKETTDRIKKMCKAMGCKLVEIPDEHSLRSVRYSELITQIDDIQAILYNSKQSMRVELREVAENVEEWLVSVRREKAIYTVLNMFTKVHSDGLQKPGGGLLGEAWIPSNSLTAVEAAVARASNAAGLYAAVPTFISTLQTGPNNNRSIPTYFEVTPLTAAFQEMNDAYGVPSYQEINPALFMLASFPFLFAVMFGDLGHGLILLLSGLFLCIFEKNLESKASRNEMFGMVYSGRYIIALMGAASIYAGMIYNDVFARSFAIWPSAYLLDRRTGAVSRHGSRVYPIGFDPVWNRASNALSVTNSYKMKQSILLGLVQMTFGLFLGALNFVKNADRLSLLTVFLPQFLFFTCFFGYLGFLIIVKWIWPKDISLIITFINMALGLGKLEGEPLYTGQGMVQRVLVCVAIICVPWMFFGLPLWKVWERLRVKMAGYEPTSQNTPLLSDNQGEQQDNLNTESKHDIPSNEIEKESLADCFMFSMIHTIEFVLGSVSNTASYLRLWALSLAHAQLSEVLWDMILEKTMLNPITLVVGFAAWFALTVAIMVIMEGLSAFLHALRLHWVEFNNKFYTGTGIRFTPLNTSERHVATCLCEENLL